MHSWKTVPHGLNREYPRYCLNCSLTINTDLTQKHLDIMGAIHTVGIIQLNLSQFVFTNLQGLL